MQRFEVSTQDEFNQAFFQGAAEIILQPGIYDIPLPDDPNKLYLFGGELIGTGKDVTDVQLRGAFIGQNSLAIKNLVMNNTASAQGLSIVDDSVATITDVSFWNDNSENNYPAIIVSSNSSLLASNILIDYQSFSGILCGKDSVVSVRDSSIPSISNYGDGAIIDLKNMTVGQIMCDGNSLFSADTLLLQNDKRAKDKYVKFQPDEKSGERPELSEKRWMVGLNKGFMLIKNLKLPQTLPRNFGTVLATGESKANIELDRQYHLEYQPWFETMDNAQVTSASAEVEDASAADIKDHPLGSSAAQKSGRDPLEELDEMIGLANVKKQVKEFISLAAYKKRRKDDGVKINNSLHSIFEGNPGTGKTTVARLVGKIAYQKGILPSNKYVEVDRSGLVAEYTGQTGPKTLKVLKKATGGVLFIDEAYSLVSDSRDSFGKEALDTILKYMEDHRDKLMIIFAGYTNDMNKLLEYNQGMKSRIPNVFTFNDYTPQEAVQIGLLQLRKSMKMKFDSPETGHAYAQLVSQKYESESEHSNARWVRNLNDKIISAVAVRTGEDSGQADDVIISSDLDDLSPNSRSDSESPFDEFYY